jgi:hypothetical protein
LSQSVHDLFGRRAPGSFFQHLDVQTVHHLVSVCVFWKEIPKVRDPADDDADDDAARVEAGGKWWCLV